MSIKNIKDKIVKDAKKQASGIKKKAKQEMEKLLNYARKELAVEKKERIKKIKAEVEEERRRILARANLEIKEMVLTEKRRGIDEAFRKAKEEILKLSDSEYIEFLEKLILQAVEGDEEIVLNRKDKERISKDLVESMNEKLKSKRRAGNIKISNEVRDIAGGFILKGDNVEINYSLSVIFQKIQEDEESEIAKILFEI